MPGISHIILIIVLYMGFYLYMFLYFSLLDQSHNISIHPVKDYLRF